MIKSPSTVWYINEIVVLRIYPHQRFLSQKMSSKILHVTTCPSTPLQELNQQETQLSYYWCQKLKKQKHWRIFQDSKSTKFAMLRVSEAQVWFPSQCSFYSIMDVTQRVISKILHYTYGGQHLVGYPSKQPACLFGLEIRSLIANHCSRLICVHTSLGKVASAHVQGTKCIGPKVINHVEPI